MKLSSDGVGGPRRTPITILNGTSKGPRLWIVSGLHGDEYDACIAATRITRLLDPRKLRGAVISIPVANVLAWESRSYESPDDHEDMLYAFPGDPCGSRTQQVANGIFSEMIMSKCDIVIDLHNGNTFNLVANHSYNFGEGEVGRRSKELSMAFGFPIVVRVEDPFEGLLMCEAAARGIPSIVAECGGEGRIHNQMIADLMGGMSNVMRRLGMIDGETPPNGEITFARWSPKPEMDGHLRASCAGYVDLWVKPGDSVSKGQTIAEVTDVFGRHAETLKAPHDSVVTELRTWATVNAGDIVAFLPVLE